VSGAATGQNRKRPAVLVGKCQQQQGQYGPAYFIARMRRADIPPCLSPEFAADGNRHSAGFVTPMAAESVAELPEGDDWIYD